VVIVVVVVAAATTPIWSVVTVKLVLHHNINDQSVLWRTKLIGRPVQTSRLPPSGGSRLQSKGRVEYLSPFSSPSSSLFSFFFLLPKLHLLPIFFFLLYLLFLFLEVGPFKQS